MKKIKSIFFLITIVLVIMLSTSVFATNEEKNTNLTVLYRTHVENIGWQDYVSNEQTAGTSGQGLRLEGINIKLANQKENLSIKYQVHVQNIGWQEWKQNDEMAGTSGQSLRLEGIRIELSNTSNYSVMYRVHVQNIGWQEWKQDGEMAGTEGQALRLEAIQIKIIKKPSIGKLYIDEPINEQTYYKYDKNEKITVTGWKMANISNSYIKAYIDNTQINSNIITEVQRPDVLNSIKGYGTSLENPKPGFKFELSPSNLNSGKHTIKIELYDENAKITEQSQIFNIDEDIHIKYQAHVENIGWQDWKIDNTIAGTVNQSKRIEAIKIQFYNTQKDVHIKYRAHIQNIGWQNWKQDGELAGTEGKSLRIEAIQVKIEGLQNYTIEYQAHVEGIGWQQWASNEMIAGTVEQSRRVEAIKVRLVKSEKTVVPNVKYSGYIQNNGWSAYTENGNTIGKDNSELKIEGLRVALQNSKTEAIIKYKAHVSYVGWMDYVTNNAQAGVIGQNKAIEAIEMELENLNGYSIEYRAYVIGEGWQDWVHDGETAGTTGASKQIGALQIRLNIDAYPHRKLASKKIDTAKYPGYKELLEQLEKTHLNWNFELLYTGLTFNEAVNGEFSNHGANLVPASYGANWICNICGTKPYDTGNWYCASRQAIAYYMDPRNFLNDSNIFQFLDANIYEPSSVSYAGIQSNVTGTFLANYVGDIDTACKNQGVNPYYVISRLIQENGSKGSYTSNGMLADNGKVYYNPFNIGAYKTKNATVKENALKSAMNRGWDSMEKALEGGIVFLKSNWLENYQNTLYQNRFDIDSTNGSALYAHQYMQNLSAAYSEGLLLRKYYSRAGTTESNLTFIIPMYEGMSSTISAKP